MTMTDCTTTQSEHNLFCCHIKIAHLALKTITHFKETASSTTSLIKQKAVHMYKPVIKYIVIFPCSFSGIFWNVSKYPKSFFFKRGILQPIMQFNTSIPVPYVLVIVSLLLFIIISGMADYHCLTVNVFKLNMF